VNGTDEALVVRDLVDLRRHTDEVVSVLGCGHHEIPVGVCVDLLDGLAGVVREDLVEQVPHPHDLAGLDLDVGSLAFRASHRLVDHHAGVGQGCTSSVLPGGERR
jgi:hypothetical protein